MSDQDQDSCDRAEHPRFQGETKYETHVQPRDEVRARARAKAKTRERGYASAWTIGHKEKTSIHLAKVVLPST